jgi:hypothetical protein
MLTTTAVQRSGAEMLLYVYSVVGIRIGPPRRYRKTSLWRHRKAVFADSIA